MSIRPALVRHHCRNGCPTQDNEKAWPRTPSTQRVLRAPAERFRAFLDADAMAKWLPRTASRGSPPHQAEVGGTYKMSFTTLTTGHSHSFGGDFLDSCPTNAFATATVRRIQPARPDADHGFLKKVSVGTSSPSCRRHPRRDSVEACYRGGKSR